MRDYSNNAKFDIQKANNISHTIDLNGNDISRISPYKRFKRLQSCGKIMINIHTNNYS